MRVLTESEIQQAHKACADIEHALKCAKEYYPDYPWDSQTDNKASQIAWALGEGYKGMSLACDDLHRIIARLKTALSDALDDNNYSENVSLLEELNDLSVESFMKMKKKSDAWNNLFKACDHKFGGYDGPQLLEEAASIVSDSCVGDLLRYKAKLEREAIKDLSNKA